MIDAVGRAEKCGLHAQAAFQQELGEVQFELNCLGRRLEFRMREGVIADFLALRVFALYDVCFLVGRFTDHEERCRRLLLFRMSRIFGVHVGIGAVVESERHFVRRGAHLLDAPGQRISLEAFVVELIASAS